MGNGNVGEEVKQVETNNAAAEKSSNGSNKNMIIKIVVGVLIFLTLAGIAVFVFWMSLANKIVDNSKDSINSIVNLGQSFVDDALEGTGMDNLESAIDNIGSAVTNNSNANSKVAITADKFSEVMNSKKFEVIESTSMFAQYPNYMKKSYIARTTEYQIEFYELTTVSDAMDMYDTNKTKFESQKGSDSSYSTMSKSNYNMYALTTNGKYKCVCRVDNTIIYLDVAQEYKDAVVNIINELGY